MIELQRLTGMRGGEAVIMRGVDIDMTGSVWTYEPAKHKTQNHGFARVIELGPRAQKVLAPFLNRDIESPLFSPKQATAERYVAAATHRRPEQEPNARRSDRTIGDSYTVASYRRGIQYACDRADRAARKAQDLPDDADRIMPRWHPHQLRHSAAFRFRKEYGIEVARIMLGHRSTVVTEIYAEAIERKPAP